MEAVRQKTHLHRLRRVPRRAKCDVADLPIHPMATGSGTQPCRKWLPGEGIYIGVDRGADHVAAAGNSADALVCGVGRWRSRREGSRRWNVADDSRAADLALPVIAGEVAGGSHFLSSVGDGFGANGSSICANVVSVEIDVCDFSAARNFQCP